jgi:hypothetical protein
LLVLAFFWIINYRAKNLKPDTNYRLNSKEKQKFGFLLKLDLHKITHQAQSQSSIIDAFHIITCWCWYLRKIPFGPLTRLFRYKVV